MLFVTLAGLSGLVWGVGDFAGGKAAQRAASLPVTVTSKIIGLPFLAVYLAVGFVPLVPASLPWGSAAGSFGLLGLLVFYRAMAAGAMTVVAPVAAVTSAALPVAYGLLSGERPGAVRLVGVACALVAIALVSLAPAPAGRPTVVTPRLLVAASGAGACFGVFFVCMARAGEVAGGTAGLWPVAASQLTSIVLGAAVALLWQPGGPPRGVALRWAAVAGPFDMTANALFLVASRAGDLSLVAPLAALYPVSTVALAVLVDRERLRPVQVVGLGLALVAVVLLSRP